ncbi:hypothetical protein AB1Y20_010470 [Prymnesium parvum]|uniref:AB hydrolase-1 domain-containing protein n=1 Tax=Prymnesium parvum TaxID=97485 RepID=A0AB34IPV2_PRYPA
MHCTSGLATATLSSARMVLNGHGSLLLGPTRPAVGTTRPPLVLIGGTAQWLESWTGHLSGLAQERQVLLYEARGQAGATSSLDVADCSLRRHAADFAGVVAEAGLCEEPFDVVGFSFGGRVAMAAAAMAAGRPPSSRPYSIRKLCVTGVAADRGALGRLTTQGWSACLRNQDLEGFAWQLILSTHSASFVAQHEHSVRSWVRAVVAKNSVAGLRAIVEQTYTDDPSDFSHPLTMAKTIRDGGGVEEACVIGGSEDVVAPLAEARKLADDVGWYFVEVDASGHAVPIEQAVRWRREVLSFLA